jgi:hypothetical protein
VPISCIQVARSPISSLQQADEDHLTFPQQTSPSTKLAAKKKWPQKQRDKRKPS